PLSNREVIADGYTTEWNLAEGDSFDVISGNIGTNTDGNPYTINTGQDSMLYVQYALTPANPTDPDLIQAGKFGIRIKIPNSFKGTLQRPDSAEWAFKEGNENDPQGTPEGNERYFWLINKTDMLVTSSLLEYFMLKPFETGITADETTLPISVSIRNLNTTPSTSISPEKTTSFVANTDTLWSTGNNGFVNGSSVSSGQTKYVNLADHPTQVSLDPLDMRLKSYYTYGTNYGISFAKSFTFNATFNIAMDADGITPLIILDESMFYQADGITPLDASDFELITNNDDKVIGYKIHKTITNLSDKNELSNPTFNYKIINAKLNGSAPEIAALSEGQNKIIMINQVEENHYVEPLVGVDASVALENGHKPIKQDSMINLGFTYEIRTNETETDSYKAPRKYIAKIAEKEVASMTPPFSAYANDTLMYELGYEHIQNKNSTAIKSIIYTEKANTSDGYDSTELLPVQIKAGVVSNSSTIREVTIKYTALSGKPDLVLSFNANSNINDSCATNSCYAIPANDRNLISSISIEYQNLPINATISKGALISYKLVDHDDLSYDDIAINNTMQSSFKKNETSTEIIDSDSISVKYKLRPFNNAGLFESDKTGLNLAGGADGRTHPVSGDVVEFIIMLTNEQGADLHVNKVIDQYSANLEAYNGTVNKVDNGTAINSKLIGAKADTLNLVLWSVDPRLGTSTPTPISGDYTLTNDPSNNKFQVEFENDIIVPAGNTYYLTYTMNVKQGNLDDGKPYDFFRSAIGNRFQSFINNNRNGEGVFYWGGSGRGTSINKYHKNASTPNSIKNPWNSAPYSNDVVTYVTVVRNDTDYEWTDSNMEFVDTFDGTDLEFISGETGINTEVANPNISDTDKLNFSAKYNFRALKGPKNLAEDGTTIINGDREYATVRDTTGVVQYGTSSLQTHYNPSLTKINDNDTSDNTFKVLLGSGNVIKPGEQVVFIYNLKVKSNVLSKDNNEYGTIENEIYNDFNVIKKDSNSVVNHSEDWWYINAHENIQGHVDLTKATNSVVHSNGSAGDYSRVENGDTINYKVNISNNHIKANRFMKFQTLHDKLPSNLSYKPNSFSLIYYKVEYDTNNTCSGSSSANLDSCISGTGTKTVLGSISPTGVVTGNLPTGTNDYTISYIDTNSDGKKDTIKVNWANPVELTAGNFASDTFQKITTYAFEFDYAVTADTSDIPSSEDSRRQTNTATIFLNNSVEEIEMKNGNKYNDVNNDLDDNANTLTYVYNSNDVYLINDNYHYGYMEKSVVYNNAPYNSVPQFDIDQTTSLGRTYQVRIYNTGARDYSLSTFVDILPEFESFNDNSLIIRGVNIDSSQITKGNYEDEQSIASRQKILYKKDIIVPANSNIIIKYSTTVDKTAVYEYMQKANYQVISSRYNSAVIYMKNNDNLIINGNNKGASFNDTVPDFDDDIKTTKAYRYDSEVSYIDKSIAPAINFSPKIIVDGAYSNYNPSTTPCNPGNDLGWDIRLGNSDIANIAIKPGAKVMVVLPEGVTFNNEYLASTSGNVGSGTQPTPNTSRPSWLDEPTITTDANSHQIIVWNINSRFDPYNYYGVGFGEFIIKTSTESNKYTTYNAEAYFIPLQDDTQDFYTGFLTSGSNAYNMNYLKYSEHNDDISALIPEMTGKTHYIKKGVYVDVYGAYGISSIKTVMYDANKNGSYNDAGDIVTSRDNNRLLSLASRQAIVTYSLKLEAVKDDTTIAGMSFIDRLPSKNDKSVVSNTNRGSKADVRLEGNGNVRVIYIENNIKSPITLNDTQYRLEYFFGKGDVAFTDADKDGVVQPNRWYSESEAISANKALNTATAIRVSITDEKVVIRQLGSVEILFDAHLGENVNDYNTKNAKGTNNFGYKLNYGTAKNLLRAEAVSVDLAADVPDAQVTIVKNIDLNNHTDNNSRTYFTSIAKNQKFNFTLVGKNDANEIVYSNNFDMSANTLTPAGYTNQTTITDLDPSLTYSLSELNNPNFSKEIVLNTEIDGDQTKHTFTVTNTWQPIKLEVEKIWKDAQGNTISTSDIDKLLGSYQSGNINVDLYNDANVNIDNSNGNVVAKDDTSTSDIDESTLSVNALKLKTDTISLSDLQADFGYLNQYNDAGTKINYAINEGNGLNYSYFSVTKNYTESGTTDKIGKFTLNNRVGGGDFELTKKDDLNNVLSGVGFTLSDPLGNTSTYTTDSSGKISLKNLNPGKYQLSETTPKVGYTPITKAIDFSILPNAKDTVIKEIINPIIKGSVNLIKEDDIGNTIKGATFDLYSKDGTKINSSDLVTNNSGSINVSDLVPNDYYFIETSVPEGYSLVSGHIDFTIILNPSSPVSLKVVNPIIRGTVELTKKDDLGNILGGDIFTKYGGATFELYDSKDNKIGGSYTTDIKGKLMITKLLPGNYYFKEISAPTGYTKHDNNINFTIESNPQKKVELEVINDIIRGSVELTKESDLKTKLSDVEFELFDKDNNKIGTSYTTNEKGIIVVDNLIPNDYYFKEVTGIEGYALDNHNIEFRVENNQTRGHNVQVKAINDIVRGGVVLNLLDEKDQHIEGATFKLYSADGTLIGSKITGQDELIKTSMSDNNGQVIVKDLIPGDYYFIQTNTAKDYLMNEDITKNIYHFNIPINQRSLTNINAYNWHPIEVDPPIKKKVSGDPNHNVDKDLYTFKMIGYDNAPMPSGSEHGTKVVKTGAGGVEFGFMKYNKTGTYLYKLLETGGDTKACDLEKDINCMIYDKNTYSIKVNITLVDGRYLKSEVQFFNDSRPLPADELVITNVYNYVIENKIVKTGNDTLLLGVLLLISSIGLIPIYSKH
ncbi:MAG: hypothetical protein LBT75_03325, partial [Bacilli bacterium]|nr:hypothetical protein [Bacilli bacterium]